MKSVMRSSMLRGSSTNVGNVTLCRSIPTLVHCVSRGVAAGVGVAMRCGWEEAAAGRRDVPQLGDER